MEKEYGTKLRLLRIMLAVLERPYGYTKKQLASRYNVSEDTIKNDFRDFSNVGLVWQQDDKHRYAFAEEKPLRQLKDLLHFSEEDQLLLMQAIDQIAPNSKRSENLKRKLASLYDPLARGSHLALFIFRVIPAYKVYASLKPNTPQHSAQLRAKLLSLRGKTKTGPSLITIFFLPRPLPFNCWSIIFAYSPIVVKGFTRSPVFQL